VLVDILHMSRRILRGPGPSIRWWIENLIKKRELGTYRYRYGIGALDRPNYAYLLFNAAALAAKLGHKRISAIEFGVAGGNGLLSMERHAAEIEKIFPVQFEIYGFDTGAGLPPPTDYRDMPYHFQESSYSMDRAKLTERLHRARLVIGDLRQTARSFFVDHHPAPIAALSYDLDFYSSTVAALEMLCAGERYYLPRVFCYFDDTVGDESELYNDFTGERLAIREFNERHETIKLCQAYFASARASQLWHHQIWIAHFFQHSQYNTFIGTPNRQLDLN